MWFSIGEKIAKDFSILAVRPFREKNHYTCFSTLRFWKIVGLRAATEAYG